jgi:hypothetical protein
MLSFVVWYRDIQESKGFFVFASVTETVHELITGTRVQFPPLGIYGFFSIAHYYLKQSKSKESGNKDN